MSSINSLSPKVIAWLFITLQSVLVWQGNRMVASIDKLADLATQTQINLASQDGRLKEVERDQLTLSQTTGTALQNLSNETRDLDRRVTKLETRQ